MFRIRLLNRTAEFDGARQALTIGMSSHRVVQFGERLALLMLQGASGSAKPKPTTPRPILSDKPSTATMRAFARGSGADENRSR